LLMSRLTVKSHRPFQWSIAIVLLSMLVSILTWFMLDDRHWSLIYGQIENNQEFKNIREANIALEKKNLELNEQVLMMQRTTSLDRDTMSLMQDEIKKSQDEAYRLREDLEFYQGIMDATRDTDGLNIQGIHVEPLAQAQSYRFKLVLTHVTKSVKVAEGSMDIVIEGMLDGKLSKLKLQDITLDDSLDLSFEFRNFKRFECNLDLPVSFTPRRVYVQLLPKGRNQIRLNKVFDWPESAS